MHAQPGTRTDFARPLACALLVLVALVGVSAAQQAPFARRIQFGIARPPQSPQLTPAQVDVVPGTIEARLEQAARLVQRGHLNDAIQIHRDLIAEDTDRVVAIDNSRFVSLRTYCHMRLAQLPAKALAEYRDRVDRAAEQLYRQGLAARDDEPLRRVIDEMFCSSWGDDALLALGDLALERAEYADARRAWQQISPWLRDPSGRPDWLALDDIDLNAHWAQIEQRWYDRTTPPDWLAYPDTDLDLADIRARLVLVSVREGNLDRAAFELDVLRRFHPQATGRLGGQNGPYADLLTRLLATAHEWPKLPPDSTWPTFAGSPSRAPSAAPIHPNATILWTRRLGLKPTTFARELSPMDLWQREFGGRVTVDISPGVDRRQRPLSIFPICVNGVVLYGDAKEVRALDVATGKPAVTADAVLYQGDLRESSAGLGRIFGRGAATVGVPQYSFTVASGVAYTRVGRVATSQIQSDDGPTSERLIGLDLQRDGLLTFQVKPDDESWSFEGAPLSDGRHVFVAMRRGDIAPRVYVACFDAATGRRLWRTHVGAADTLTAGQANEITHNLLTRVGNRLYLNTNFGLVAALEAADGRIAWIHRYQRAESLPDSLASSGPTHFDRSPSPCMVVDGLVLVAPVDTPNVFALDAGTGKMIWNTDQLASALHLLGVADEQLIVTGSQFSLVDIKSGRAQHSWPEAASSGIRGLGRGVLAGHEVFWPTRSALYVFDPRSGEPTRPPISLQSIASSGANLIAAGGFLVAVGPDRMMAIGPSLAGTPPIDSESSEPIADYERAARTPND